MGTILKPEGLSERWGVPLRTLDRWRWMGTGPIFMKFGKHVSYKLKDVEAFEEERRRRDTTCVKPPTVGPILASSFVVNEPMSALSNSAAANGLMGPIF